ncbi:hypothetical protein NLJ89_g3395 [Agrocybe chaxingu]|uniref:Sodium/calcium exchanger membrane region domain-containing protein n=1 Tax=Agrocybe chaxingu TaxID=84603 RepID=A0A9W8K445_9AGAR|nr:hypothetical protein NLJ89_g3395 [Agrocybe chaxingu]
MRPSDPALGKNARGTFDRGPTLPPFPRRSDTIFSSSSIDSRCNLVGQSDVCDDHRQDLPSYYPYGSRDGSLPGRTIGKFGNWKTAFYGWRFAFGSWLNIFLVLIPVSWATTFTMRESHGLTFALCILVLMPLLHDISTRELANRIGGSKTGLLNGSMSNFVEIVVAVSALRKCELRVVQSMLIGSMLSKILLVLGLCFFAGGMNFSEQEFDPTATQIHSSLLSLSVGAVVLPAAYHFTLSSQNDATFDAQKQNILHMSHGVSIVLLFIYLAYLLFQLWSHTYLYKDQHNKKSHRLSAVIKEKRIRRKAKNQAIPLTQSEGKVIADLAGHDNHVLDPPNLPYAGPPLSSTSTATLGSEPSSDKLGFLSRPSTVQLVNDGGVPMNRESAFSSTSTSIPYGLDGMDTESTGHHTVVNAKKEPKMSWFLTITLLILVTGTVAVTVDWLVEAMDGISTTISKEWVGLILLPAVSSVAECITAVRVSVKDELSLSVSVAVGSTIVSISLCLCNPLFILSSEQQTALFVIPFTVVLGWITEKPLSLLMDPFQSMASFANLLYEDPHPNVPPALVHTMNYVVADGKSNWLEGVILICEYLPSMRMASEANTSAGLYVIIAVSFWFYPGSNISNSLAVCTPSL